MENHWEIFRGYNTPCSLIGDKCHGEFDHHTHNLCKPCFQRKTKRENKRQAKKRIQQQYEDKYLSRAKQYVYETLDYSHEQYLVRRNKRVTQQLGLLRRDPMYRHYKNHCEECGGLLNSRTMQWWIFLLPNTRRQGLLVCKTCFAHLAEMYFSSSEANSYEYTKNKIEPPKLNERKNKIGKVSEIEELQPYDNMVFEDLVNTPWWTEPPKVQTKQEKLHTQEFSPSNISQHYLKVPFRGRN